MKQTFYLWGWLLILILLLTACQTTPTATPLPTLTTPSVEATQVTAKVTRAAPKPQLKVLAVETFLADMAQNVAGDRLQVTALMPIGVDPHSFEPTPADMGKVAECDVLIINGADFEGFLNEMLKNTGGQPQIIEAAAGLTMRQPAESAPDEEGDPHFWLDANNVIPYVENIRDGLSQADPPGQTIYAANTRAYTAQLKALDQWIKAEVEKIPPQRRLLVTNHESFGYFADRYGFKISGTIVPSASSSASPSAQQLARLIDHIKETGAPAIFLETGTNPQLAQQVAQETGVKVVSDLYSHSTSAADGPAPTYLEMMRYNTKAIVDALK